MLSNIPVTWRMIASALLPTLALLFFSSSTVLEEWRYASTMETVEDATHFSREISQLVHELQRERGRSAGFVGSQGEASYRNSMQAQRTATDAALARYVAARQDISATLSNQQLNASLQHVDQLLAELPAHRNQIDRLDLALGATVGQYTQTIAAMLETVARISRLGASSQMVGLLNLMSAKENAGIERAVGSNIYASRSIPPALHQRAMDLAARQNAYFLEFRELMGDEWSERLNATLAHPDAVAVDEARRNITNAGYGEPLSAMTGSDWFELTTRRIELLMELENELAQSIIQSAMAERGQARNTALFMLLMSVMLVTLTLLAAAALMWSVVKPLARITEGLRRLAAGDLDVVIQGADRGDEIGVLAKTAESFKTATREREEAVRERAKAEQDAMQERRKVLTEMAAEVEKATLESVGSVAEAAQSLSASSQTIRTTLDSAGNTASQVTSATEQNVKHTGRAAELASELSSAIGEVTQQITRGDALARNAISEAERSRQSVEELNEAAQQISDFIGLITDIAEQTNLLALNATIEAARAGDAGKGFAVVASEVKALAAQTNQSTTQIAERVAQIQSRTQSTVEAMNAITQSIETIGEVTASVAAAMEEQSASTGSLSSFVDQNRQALARVSADITELVQMTTRSAQDAENMARLVQTMADTANDANSSIPKIVQQAVAAADRRREERQPSRHNAEVSVKGERFKVVMTNATRLGVRVEGGAFRPGQTVTILSPALEDVATVIWAKDGAAGLSFDAAISEEALQLLLDAGVQAAAA